MENDIERKLSALVGREPRYREEAYRFVAAAVNFTVGRLNERRHVSAAELLAGVVDFSRQEFGVMRRPVLNFWGIRSGTDVGEIVYLLIGEGILSASPEDRPGDFLINFDLFAEAEPAPPPAEPLPQLDAPVRRRRRRS